MKEDNILLKVDMSNFTNTVNGKRYGLFLRCPWRKVPDSLKKLLNFVACCVRRKITNYVKHRLLQILNYVGLFANSAKVVHEDISFFVFEMWSGHSRCSGRMWMQPLGGLWWHRSRMNQHVRDLGLYFFLNCLFLTTEQVLWWDNVSKY